MRFSFFLLSGLLLLGSSALADRKWDDANNPDSFDPTYLHDFNELPLSGKMDPSGRRGWADSYWPKVRGYIADRWKSTPGKFKDEKSPSLFEIMNLSEEKIEKLSPAEKFDLARGRYDFPVSTRIRKEVKENEKDWRGLCNGWTHASLNYPEPNPVEFIDPRFGKKIRFGSSDLKGLLAYYHAKLDTSSARYIGRSCRPSTRFIFNLNGACSDVHPAAFHIMMANELGIRHQGFAADRDPSVQVWNQPFIQYESRIDQIKTRDISKRATEFTRKEVILTTTLTYVNELYDTENPLEEGADHVAPSDLPVLGTPLQKTRTIEYQYLLELDYADRIIGGEWISEMRPDLIWKQDFEIPGVVSVEKNKTEDWSLLNELIEMATAGLRD